jgi:hypothetical protein
VNYLLKGPERVEQEASEIIRKQREAEKWNMFYKFIGGANSDWSGGMFSAICLSA